MEFNAAPPQFNGPLAQFKVQGSKIKVQCGFELWRSSVELAEGR